MAAPASGSGLKYKLAFIGIIVAVALWKCYPLDKSITLGLDLQGGTHMVLDVHLDDAERTAAGRIAEEVRRVLTEGGVAVASVVADEARRIVATGIAATDKDKASELLERFQVEWSSSTTQDGFVLTLRDAARAELRRAAARQVRDTIDRRINEFGLREPQVNSSGEEGERIVLQLPGLDDVERVKGIITKAAVMEFRLGRGTGISSEAVVAALGGTLPGDVEILPGTAGAGRNGKAFFAVDRGAVVLGEDLVEAKAQADEFGKPCISFGLSGEAGQRFGAFTSKHLREPLAVVLDGQVIQYATIQSTIFANGQITGGFSVQEASDAALRLKSGSLPAKVSIQFEQTVGPWLGRDSIAAGTRAVMVGFVAVMIFMLVFYKGAGVNAVVALVLNIVLILAVLAWFGATLTLPGIAGIVLTIGMAVDANVIIFERIKEELAAGRGAVAAVDAGFRKAFSSILDSNLTTLFAALFLYNYGTGPIKGFAITLMIGLASSMFTAIYVSRALFDLLFEVRPGLKNLSIQWTPFHAPSIRFLRLAPAMIGLSVLALLGSIVAWSTVGLNYGIDFRGGTQVVVQAGEGIGADELRTRLAGSEFAGVPIQEYGDPETHQYLLRLQDAEAAVATATVNAGGDTSDDRLGAGTRLVAALSATEQTGALDLNSAGQQSVRESLEQGGSLPPEEAQAAAAAIFAYRTSSGGMLTSVAEAQALPGVSARAGEWLGQNARTGSLTVVSSESVGPSIGAELKSKALSAVLWSLAAILAYMWFRFELRFGVAAIVAVGHDVLVTIGLLALLGKEFDLNIIAALLTLVGYSLNDTIITFDRVRENMRSLRGESLRSILDISMNQTLSRSILTSGTVFIAVVSLLLLGGPVLNGFALTMTVGVLVGTYSSVFVANPLVLAWDKLRVAATGRRETRAA